MKKIFLLILLLFQLSFAFGQSEWTEYGSWFSSRCFPQIQTRIKVHSNPKINTTSVMVEFKNNYSRKVTFNYNGFSNSTEAEQVFAEKGTLLGGSQSSISLSPGKTSTYTFSIKGLVSNRAYIEIYSLYFDNDYRHYQKCSDGSVCLFCQVAKDPACPNYSRNNTNQANNSNNNQNAQPTTTTSNLTVQTNKSQPNQNINIQQNTDEQRQQPLTEFNNTIKDFMQSIPNIQESKETLDKMKNFELAKLEVEPEFNIVSSPNDYNKVSLTTINYQNLDKKGNVAVSIITSALSNVDKAKDKAFKSAKIQSAFLGANTLFIKVIEMGAKTLGGPYNYPTTDVFGIAYSDKKINFEMFKQFIETNKNFKIVKCLSHKVNTNDINTEKCGKTIMISEVAKKDDKIKITANIDGISETYTVINFNSNGFTLMNKIEEDNKRAKLYNYTIEIQ